MGRRVGAACLKTGSLKENGRFSEREVTVVKTQRLSFVTKTQASQRPAAGVLSLNDKKRRARRRRRLG